MSDFHFRVNHFLIFLALATGHVQAHDFWMEAAPYYSEPGNSVDISLHIGVDFVGDSRPNIYSWYDDFSLYQQGEIREVAGNLGDDPAGHFIPDKNGTYLVGHQTTFTYVELEAKKFNTYLRDEGLNNALSLRQTHGFETKPGKENYIRHAKILIQAGESFEVDDSLTRIGYILEISPLENPYTLRRGDTLTLRIDYKGQPDPDLLLIAFSKNNPERSQRIRSDTQGLATIHLDDEGPWLVKAVKILRLNGHQADWQSHWASLTFSIKP